MPTPHPPRPPYPPPGAVPGDSDEALAARLTGATDDEVAHSTGLLMARHWQPVHEYAVICLASSAPAASMVTATAFHQVFDRLTLGEPGVALRPPLLVAVRDTVRRWSADDRISGVLPALLKPAGGRGMRAAGSLTPENRKLAERAFQGLAPLARCLLWHTEVEAEPITVPAALLGLDTESASAALEQARDTFREGVVRAHRELAPSKECGFYNRLLDVPIRRGGTLLPDVQQHLDGCRYCRSAAEQLSQAESQLGTLLAEAVLGWGARRYLDSRPGRSRANPRGRRSGRHGGRARRNRLLARVPTPVVLPTPRALLTGVGVASAGLLATVLITNLWSYDGDADPAASSSAVGGTGSQDAPGVSSAPPDNAALPGAVRRIVLRNAASDLCLGVRGTPRAGSGTELAECSDARGQQWSYEDDGLLRSVAEPGLCLDSHADAGVVILGVCAPADAERGADVRYDLTVRGELLPRWEKQLALAATTDAPGADIVVKVRDGSDSQRWLTGSPSASQGALSGAGTESPSARRVELPGHSA
ncbi:RICIN domain-containing protein [Streptomyces broussonetiae]|uniref:RICIN domain-containing protein n=1 Tax=Streptomyces broussonetiae TaxID=2686304 RepID=A0ABV5ED85_9ACTN